MEIKNDHSVEISSKSPDVNLEIQYDVSVVRYSQPLRLLAFEFDLAHAREALGLLGMAGEAVWRATPEDENVGMDSTRADGANRAQHGA